MIGIHAVDVAKRHLVLAADIHISVICTVADAIREKVNLVRLPNYNTIKSTKFQSQKLAASYDLSSDSHDTYASSSPQWNALASSSTAHRWRRFVLLIRPASSLSTLNSGKSQFVILQSF